ncbi:hypothetical protein Desor_3580 [Desulfosporosinus orientis DSM 765]|uniref:Uncharacterized protein n=1 Tax=Desulfosporosinus orientis (strain ATCC 19365 / DSM 765 / NCIMB 8382 / VKM B-1628 / Singapore I) TaxID=768706 RepID=G7WII7_DESOD|nr:hypothetical protein [Desulfosporosinus orientis]AET69061.1 hypothetical protein Desor_3580 [Desulfosporosinus orientis DSM 765]
MKTFKRTLLVLIFGVFGIVLTGSFWFSTPQVTEAACGASTTSCKTCHEIKGEDPVSQKGDWHTQHAFADFCQACHLGVATENDKEKAHVGMVLKPLEQADQSCASCHPADTAARVAKYGGTVTTNPANSADGNSTDSKTGNNETSGGGSITVSDAAMQVPNSANPNYDVIDFNANEAMPWLAWAIGIINVFMLLVLAVLIWRWKKGLWPWALILGRTKKVPFKTLPPEVQEVFTQLLEGDIKTVLSLKKIIEGEHGAKVLQAVSNLPDQVFNQLLELDDHELKSLSSLKDLMRNERSEQNHGL